MQLEEKRETCADCAGVVLEVSKVVESDPQNCMGGAPYRLAELEAIIDRGLQPYREIGKALLEIREQRLYRSQGFGTFEDYCRERWGWNSRQVPYNYIGAAQAAENVQTSGHIGPSLSQAVELSVLPAKQQNEAVKAIESCGKSFDTISVREVREVVHDIRSKTIPLADQETISQALQTPVSRVGDCWLCGPHRVLCDDSTDIDAVKRVLDGELADMGWTDPPYNVGYTGKNRPQADHHE